MKKIIPILLSIVMLFALTIPAFADDTLPVWDGKNLTGTTWTVPIGWTVSAGYGDFNVNGDVVFTNGATTDFNKLLIGKNGPSSLKDNFIVFGSASFDNAIGFTVTFNGGNDVANTSLISLLFDVGTLTSHNYVEPECDGSACPANDANLDGLCDDCGYAMTMSLRSPTLEEMKASAPYYHYFIYKTVDTTTGAYVDHRLSFVSSYSPMTLTSAEWDRTNDSAWGSVSFRFTGDSDIDGVNYVSTDGGYTWQRETTYSNGTTLFYVDDDFVSSTFDFTDRDTGEIFFPLPLWEITQGVTMETLETQTLGAVAGTITTLTLCGVGLMALLVVLSLFGKRSLISRH